MKSLVNILLPMFQLKRLIFSEPDLGRSLEPSKKKTCMSRFIDNTHPYQPVKRYYPAIFPYLNITRTTCAPTATLTSPPSLIVSPRFPVSSHALTHTYIKQCSSPTVGCTVCPDIGESKRLEAGDALRSVCA